MDVLFPFLLKWKCLYLRKYSEWEWKDIPKWISLLLSGWHKRKHFRGGEYSNSTPHFVAVVFPVFNSLICFFALWSSSTLLARASSSPCPVSFGIPHLLFSQFSSGLASFFSIPQPGVWCCPYRQCSFLFLDKAIFQKLLTYELSGYKTTTCRAKVVCTSFLRCLGAFIAYLFKHKCFTITRIAEDDIIAVLVLLYILNVSSHPLLNNNLVFFLSIMNVLSCFGNSNFHISQSSDSIFSEFLSNNPGGSSWVTEIAWPGRQLAFRDVHFSYSLRACAQTGTRSCLYSSQLKQ